MIKKIGDELGGLLTAVFYRTMSMLDISTTRKIGMFITYLWYLLDQGRRNLALKNVKQALKVDDNEAKRIIRENYKHYGMMIGEIVKWKYIRERAGDYFEIEGKEILENLKGKGFILLTGHIGNWEIATIAFTTFVGEATAIVKKIQNNRINQIVTDIRKGMGLKLITGKNTVFQMMKKLRQGEILIFLLDQNAPVREAVFVNFFGRPASTFKVVAMLAIKFEIPVVPAYCIRKEDGTFKVVIEKPFHPVKGKTLEESVRLNTQQYTDFIEKVVKLYPEQWFWVHNRWKNQPEVKIEKK